MKRESGGNPERCRHCVPECRAIHWETGKGAVMMMGARRPACTWNLISCVSRGDFLADVRWFLYTESGGFVSRPWYRLRPVCRPYRNRPSGAFMEKQHIHFQKRPAAEAAGFFNSWCIALRIRSKISVRFAGPGSQAKWNICFFRIRRSRLIF